MTTRDILIQFKYEWENADWKNQKKYDEIYDRYKPYMLEDPELEDQIDNFLNQINNQ